MNINSKEIFDINFYKPKITKFDFKLAKSNNPNIK